MPGAKKGKSKQPPKPAEPTQHENGLEAHDPTREEVSAGEATATTSGRLVVIGSSAGGIEALTALIQGLPKGLPAPVVIAQHLDPARQSNLAAILQRGSRLPIVPVTEKTELKQGTIYVVPA